MSEASAPHAKTTGAVTFEPGPETVNALRGALGRFATGVTLVTCESDMGPLGIVANSFASVSLDPPLVLWSPAKSSRRHDAFVAAPHFAIHVLSIAQKPLCSRFARDGFDFSGLDWHRSEGSVPLIEGCLARFECDRHAAHDGGDHTIILGALTRAFAAPQSEPVDNPLVFYSGKYGGFSNADAPPEIINS